MTPQARKLLPILPAIFGNENSGILHPGVDGVRIGQGRFKMPDTLEFPRVRGAVVPQVGAWDAIIGELVTHGFPRFSAVIGALNHLPKPAAGLGSKQAVRVSG